MLELNFVLFLFLGKLCLAATRASNQVVSVPQQYTYLLPDGFEGNTNYTFVNGTQTSSSEINKVLNAAKKAPIVSYDQDFLDIVGSNPEIKLIEERKNDDFAYEMGVWIPKRNEVWFTSAVEQGRVIAPTLYALNLSSNAVSEVQTSEHITNANGGYYFEGKVYIATYPNNASYSGGIVAVDVKTLEVETILNSYFGLRYNGVDDIVWATGSDGCKYMYFTDLNFAYLGYDNLPPLQLPAGTYRWDPQNQVVLPVIGRTVNPNGIRVSPDMKTLYVTDSTATFAGAGPYSPPSGPADTFWLGPYIYAYDLDSHMMPVNGRVFGMARQGIADGMHVDDAGNVYTGEWEGVVVRNPAGKTIGVFNSQFFQADKDADALALANFALAGDTLVVLSTTRLWTVKLAKTVVNKDSPIVN